MTVTDFTDLTIAELLATHSAVLNELRRRITVTVY